MLTVKEYSELTGNTERQTYDLVRSGRLKSSIVEGRIMIEENQKFHTIRKKVNKNPWITCTEAGKMLGMSRQGVQYRADRGYYKSNVIDGIYHVLRRDVEKELDKSTKKRTCSNCGAKTNNRMLCDRCYTGAESNIFTEYGVTDV